MTSGSSFRSASEPARATNKLLGEPLYRFPTTLGQQSFWYLDRLEPGNPCWNIAVRFRISGDLDPTLLDRSINEIVRRHEILRTTFELIDGTPAQLVHSDARIPLPVDDLSHLPASELDMEEERRTVADAALRFDLKSGPLIRTRLLKLAEREHMLLVAIHHIVSDGWSIGNFTDELAAHYQDLLSGTASHLKPLPLQYADYAVWKNEQERTLAALHRAYWQGKLANLPNCEIPADYPRLAENRQRGYILSTLLSTDLTQRLSVLSRAHACTLYTTCLAALKILIAHYTHQTDVYVGTLVAGRDRPELETLIGLFINTLILRTNLSGDPTFLELLGRVKETVEEGLAHQDLPFQQVAESLRLKRHPSRPTLYSINFIYQRDFVRPLQFAGLTLIPVPSKSPGAIYDLNFFMVERSDGWRLSCEYNYDLYDASSVSRMLAQFRGLLEQVLENPNRKISGFSFPTDAGDPLPPFVPRAAQHQPTTEPTIAGQTARPSNAAFTFKKILSRVYTQFGKS